MMLMIRFDFNKADNAVGFAGQSHLQSIPQLNPSSRSTL